MAECTPQTVLDFHPQLPIRLEFDAPQISSDGGAVLLRSTDDRLGLSSGIAELIPDSRDADRVLHSRHEQVMQRAFQIALGYEDANDAEFLRNDPVLKMSCDRTPSDSVGLSSQPTLSRLENAVDGMTIRRLTRWIEDRYVASLPNDSDLVILDIDATDDPTYGQQQLTFFHGYYDQHMYHPLLVFDGETGQLITALLRPGNTHASRGARGVLSRLIRKIKARFPELQIVVRGDSGFAMPRIMEKLGLNHRSELVRFALKTGLLKQP